MFSTIAKHQALDAVTVDRISLHTGDPGSSGTANEVSGGGYARQSATFGAAAGGARALSAPVEFSGPASGSVTWIGIWQSGSPDTFKARAPLTGDTSFNSAGEFILVSATLSLDEC